MKMGKWSIVFAVVLTLLSAYMLLDTFVIPEAYVEDASQSGQQALQVVAETESEHSENAVTEESADKQYECICGGYRFFFRGIG